MLDHPHPFEHRLTARTQLHSAELDAFLKDIGGELRQRADVAAPDVDPVHHHHHEADQHRELRRIDWRVHGDVVEVLADRSGVIGYDDVTLVKLVRAVELQPVLNRRAHHIGNEHRHARGALADQVAVRIHDTHCVVLVFVDVRAERGSCDVYVDFVGDGHKPPPNHFNGDGVERLRCSWPPGSVNFGSQCRSPRVCRW